MPFLPINPWRISQIFLLRGFDKLLRPPLLAGQPIGHQLFGLKRPSIDKGALPSSRKIIPGTSKAGRTHSGGSPCGAGHNIKKHGPKKPFVIILIDPFRSSWCGGRSPSTRVGASQHSSRDGFTKLSAQDGLTRWVNKMDAARIRGACYRSFGRQS